MIYQHMCAHYYRHCYLAEMDTYPLSSYTCTHTKYIRIVEIFISFQQKELIIPIPMVVLKGIFAKTLTLYRRLGAKGSYLPL